jgi:hypothetical protein
LLPALNIALFARSVVQDLLGLLLTETTSGSR